MTTTPNNTEAVNQVFSLLGEIGKNDKRSLEAVLGIAIVNHILDSTTLEDFESVMELFFHDVRIRVVSLIREEIPLAH
jgi:hypothetical protein